MSVNLGGFCFVGFPEYMCFIVAGDYQEFPDDMAFIERQKIVRDRARVQLQEYLAKQGKECIIYDWQIYIFWKNVPRTYIDICNNDYLFYCICQQIKTRLNGEDTDFSVYIDNMSTFSEGKMDVLLKRLCMLYTVTKCQPTFLDFDMIKERVVSGCKQAGEYTKSNTVANILERLFAGEEADCKYANTLALVNSLMIAACGENAFDLSEFEADNFIKEYIRWQTGEITVEKACKNLNNMSKRTFYKYVAEIEMSPLYPQFMYTHENELRGKEKKGYLPEDWDSYLKDTETKFVEESPGVFKTIDVDEISVCKKYNLLMESDVLRIRLAIEKKMKAKMKREQKNK